MLTEHTRSFIKSFIKVSHKLKYTVLTVNDETGKIELSSDLKQYIYWLLTVLYIALYWITLVAGIFTKIQNGSWLINTENFALNVLFLCSFSTTIWLSFGTALRLDELVEYLNQALWVDQMFSEKEIKRKQAWEDDEEADRLIPTLTFMDRMSKYLPLLFPWWFWNSFAIGFFFILQPYDPMYVFPYLGINNFYVAIIFLILDINAIAYIIFGVMLYWYICFVVLNQNMNCWLKKISSSTPTTNMNEDPNEAMKDYRTLQILNQMGNGCLSKYMWTFFMFTNLSNHVLYTAISIKSHTTLGIVGLVVFPFWATAYIVVELVVYYISGKVYDNSQRFASSWAGRTGWTWGQGGGTPMNLEERSRRPIALDLDMNDRIINMIIKYESRKMRAINPFGVQVAGVLVVKKCWPLIILYIVSSVVINCILIM